MNSIVVNKRDVSIKPKKLRKTGLVPGNIFGRMLPESIAIQLNPAEARFINQKLREGSQVLIQLGEKKMPAQIKEKSTDNLTNDLLHVDFQLLEANHVFNSVIHILYKNTETIPNALERLVTEIPYSTTPENMIDTITIDVSGMKEGDMITIEDIDELKSDKIELHLPSDEIVVRVNERKTA